MTTLTEKLSKLSPEQRAALEKKLRAKRKAKASTTSSTAAIAPRADQNTYPFSAGQQRLWLLEQLDPDSAAYNITDAFHLRGRLDAARLESALQAIQNRHDVLRARFETVNDQPVQHVAPPHTADWEKGGRDITPRLDQVDLRDTPPSQKLIDARHLVSQSDSQPFQLHTGPLWRVLLLRLDEAEYVLALTIHHIIADRWSLGLFMDELRHFYSQPEKSRTTSQEAKMGQNFSEEPQATDTSHHTAGQPTPLADLPIQYADFAQWQSTWLASDTADKQRTFWQETFSGAVEPLELPVTDHQGAILVHSHNHGSQARHTIPPHVIEAAQTFCQQHDLSLFVLLLSAFEATLHRYTEQTDLIVCTPIVARRQIELENLIGYFNNIVALRTPLAEDATFADLVQQNHQVVLDAYEHQELPFHIVTEQPTLTRVPLARALISLAEQDGPALTLPNVAVETLHFDEDSADFDWSLFLDKSSDGLECELIYRSNMFDADLIATFLQDFEQLLTQGIANPSARIGTLSIAGTYSPILQPEAETAFDAPVGAVEEEVAAVWRDVLGLAQVGRNQNFFELGGHSMLAVRLFRAIEQRITGNSVPLSLLLQAPTVAQMAQALHGDDVADGFSLVVPIQPVPIQPVANQTLGEKPPIFFMHPAGGNVLYYVDLARHLANYGYPSYGVQAQGLDGKQPILETVAEMTRAYLPHIRAVQPRGPYMVAGYCLGGTIALDVAHQLAQQGEEVAFLGLLETHNWVKVQEDTLLTNLQHQSQRVEYHLRNFMLLDGEGRQSFLKEKAKVARDRTSIWSGSLKSIFGKDATDDDERTEDELLSKIWDINDLAADTYVPPETYAGKITQILPKEDYAAYDDPRLGWEEIAQGGVDQLRLPVYPAGMLIEPFVAELAREMAQRMDEALKLA